MSDVLAPKQLHHLLYRICFGPSPLTYERYTGRSAEEVVDQLLAESAQVRPIEIIKAEKFPIQQPKLKKGQLQERRKRKRNLRGAKERLNFFWMQEMANSEAQIAERMALFWHDHFACNVGHPLLAQRQINIFRTKGLAYFGDLVVEIAKDPAMIIYLNSRENVKNNPNENFGRELLELFTIGIGHYTEQDIKEAARAFTGWRFDDQGQFYIDPSLHDEGIKSFLGQSGYFSGDDIIDMLLRQPHTGDHIVSKLYAFLTGVPITQERLTDLSDVFYRSNYHIGLLVRAILTASWFYDDAIIGQRIKSPVDLIVQTMRLTQPRFKNGKYLMLKQIRFKQKLLYPPGVDGWREDREWIDLSTVPERMRLGAEFLAIQVPTTHTVEPISDEGDEFVITNEEQLIKISFDLKPLKQLLADKNRSNEADGLISLIYTCPIEHLEPLLSRWIEEYRTKSLSFRMLLGRLLSLPEYQLS